MMLKILTAAALVATANGAITKWNQANGMCGGTDDVCTDVGTCSTTGVGPCAAGDKAPKWHVTSEFVGLAFTAPGYLTEAKKMKQITPATTAQQVDASGEASVNGFRNSDLAAVGGGGKYIYTMTGGIMGDSPTAWGYAGIASYFNSGDTVIKTNTNDLYGAGSYSPNSRKTYGDNNDGAPAGPFKVCITKLKDGKCGDEATFKPGDYKFSIFGTIRGTEWAAKTTAGQNGFPAGQTHMGVRMKVTANGIAFDKVTLNGNVDIADIGETDVATLTLTQTGGTQLTYKFPKNFNVGDYNTMVKDAKTKATTVGTASGNVVIHVSKVSANTLHIDYLFPLTAIGATADKYFVYDPTINTDLAGNPKGGAGQLAASGFVAVVVAAVSQLF